MGKTIELPDPFYAEIDRYAVRTETSPLIVLKQAWTEFSQRHAHEGTTPLSKETGQADLLAMVHFLRGSISLPADCGDEELITEARLEKHGPL